MPTVDYKIGLLKRLQNTELAQLYLSEAKKLGDPEYRLALEDVAEAIAMNAQSMIPKNLGADAPKFFRMLDDRLRKLGSNGLTPASKPRIKSSQSKRTPRSKRTLAKV